MTDSYGDAGGHGFLLGAPQFLHVEGCVVASCYFQSLFLNGLPFTSPDTRNLDQACIDARNANLFFAAKYDVVTQDFYTEHGRYGKLQVS